MTSIRILTAIACLGLASFGIAAEPQPPTVVAASSGESAYRIAAEAFRDTWAKVTAATPAIVSAQTLDAAKPPAGNLVLIGSDAVNPLVHRLIAQARLESLGIRYGTDDYRLLALADGGRTVLIVAGGSGRSTIYAVYDFFRRQAGAEYFWDGDVIPRRPVVNLAGVDVLEQPRFTYRGLRYFAHRGLQRFQAEQWDLDDWKHEIDWLLKKRFNLFMLRTGIDDLFQRAFPDEVPYPPTDGVDPDAQPRSYDDRTSFWPLKYRGELRKRVLQYARDRGLLHPEDTGTITHWYSHTPSAFYRSRPDFPVIRDQASGYKLPTQAIWDIEDQRTWDTYWRLTETHIREFGAPQIFHTIGMAERTFGKDDRDNLQRKLYVYRKTEQKLREHYPDAPLLIASWDFIGWKWTDADIRRLTDEFDPRRTIIHEYTADMGDKVTFQDWGLLGRFPWNFGIFHGFARNSDIHEDYAVLAQRLRLAAADEKCLGLFLWSEISHSDTFLLEYLGENSWRPAGLECPHAVDRFCRTRYPAALAERMRTVWSQAMAATQLVHWAKAGPRTLAMMEPQFRILTSPVANGLSPERLATLRGEQERFAGGLKSASGTLAALADLTPAAYENDLWRRDALDIARTIADRALMATLIDGALQMEAWRTGGGSADAVRHAGRRSQALLAGLGDLLAQSDDFSMAAGLKRLCRVGELGGVAPQLNPHAEQTLKGNAENDYCRSHHYELVRYVYQPEYAAYWDWVGKQLDTAPPKAWRRPPEPAVGGQKIRDAFYNRPLADMAPRDARGPQPLAEALRRLAKSIAE